MIIFVISSTAFDFTGLAISINNPNIMSSFVNDIISNFNDVVLNKYVKFEGRAGRREFWMFALAMCLISVAFGILGAVFSKISAILLMLQIIEFLVSLALLLPSLALSVRRLHDIGKEWPWILINFIPIIGMIWYIILMAKPSK